MNKYAPIVVPLASLIELSKADAKSFINKYSNFRKRFPSATGTIIVGYRNGNPVSYWSGDRFIDFTGITERPKTYESANKAIQNLRKVRRKFPDVEMIVCLWVHPILIRAFPNYKLN
jgi:hypothetical protein